MLQRWRALLDRAGTPGAIAPRPHPTVIHVTHWKAGSQWVHRILHYCCADRIVTPQSHEAHFLGQPVRSGMVYPTVYVTKPEFDQVRVPEDCRRFVVIRDLRDTLVSYYFSAKISHVADRAIRETRPELLSRSVEDGLIWLIQESRFWRCAAIQRSWHAAGEPLVRYEDLLERDEAILEQVLLRDCGLPVAPDLLRAAVRDTRFERLTGGRPRGQEDQGVHERKGIAGDWRNHFTDRVKQAFKARFGDLVVATGYERDHDW